VSRMFDYMGKNKVEIRVTSDYGSNEILRQADTTIEIIEKTMNSLNWNEFQVVNLSRNDEDWISLSGNLSDEGLACVYEENNDIYIIVTPPNTIKEMKEILISYYEGDGIQEEI